MDVLAVVLAALVAVFAGTLYLYLVRSAPVRDVRWLGDGDAASFRAGAPFFVETLQLLTGTSIAAGHRMEVLANGDELFPRLFDDLRRAKTLITWQVFWLRPGRLADDVGQVLAERARHGVRVLVLLDAFGSRDLGDDYQRMLRAAGVEVAIFRPLRATELYKAQQRMHVRSVVIDGDTGYTGGFGIDDRWTGDGTTRGHWRDTNVRLAGPAVDRLQVAFAANWAETTGTLVAGRDVYSLHDRLDHGDQSVGVVHGVPSLGSTAIERLFILSILGAHERLFITNPYFLPDATQRRMLVEAARRGVDVRVLTPGGNTDRRSAWLAARSHYDELITGGIRVYEYDPTMIHAKTFVVDGRWSCVGTINFDNRSMKLNDEVGVLTTDEGIAARLEALFVRDLERSTEVSIDRVRSRSRWERVRQQAARSVAPLL